MMNATNSAANAYQGKSNVLSIILLSDQEAAAYQCIGAITSDIKRTENEQSFENPHSNNRFLTMTQPNPAQPRSL
jgi:hypothetical protein